jgi:hypothetical protein
MKAKVDYIYDVIGKVVVMDGEKYVFLEDLTEVSEEIIKEAILLNEKAIEENRVSEIKKEAGKIIIDLYPQFKQMNAQLGIYGQAYLDEMVAFITNIKAQSDSFELDISKTKEDFIY